MKYHKTKLKRPHLEIPGGIAWVPFGFNCADRKRDTSRTDVRWHREAWPLVLLKYQSPDTWVESILRMWRQRNKDDTEMQGSRGEIQEEGVISQEAVTGPRYTIKDQSSVETLWKGFLFLCRGDSLPSHSSREVLPG